MNTAPANHSPIVIIGGGIAGLSAAWQLQQQNQTYIVLEQSSRWGGKIWTEHVQDEDGNTYICEIGADAFLTRKPAALALARELKLDDRIVGTNPDTHSFILKNNKLTALPDGMPLLVPTKIMPFLRSSLFSPLGKIRILLERFIPPKRDNTDETLADFVRRRLGQEALATVADPLLAGIYNANAERQSISATFPQFPQLEQKYGSLLAGIQAQKRNASPTAEKLPPFISFKTGAHELIDALVSQLSGDLRLESTVKRITHADNRYTIHLNTGDTLTTDTVIITIPANHAAELCAEIAPQAAQQLATIPFNSIGAVTLAYHRKEVPHPLNGAGIVIPSTEKRDIDGITWTSSKWAGRAPQDRALLRVFFGGPNSKHTMTQPDDQVIATIRKELQNILGIEASPIFAKVNRWQEAYPQYEIGHAARVTEAESALPAGVYITGSSYHGIGVPDCIKQARETAQNAVKWRHSQETMNA